MATLLAKNPFLITDLLRLMSLADRVLEKRNPIWPQLVRLPVARRDASLAELGIEKTPTRRRVSWIQPSDHLIGRLDIQCR